MSQKRPYLHLDYTEYSKIITGSDRTSDLHLLLLFMAKITIISQMHDRQMKRNSASMLYVGFDYSVSLEKLAHIGGEKEEFYAHAAATITLHDTFSCQKKRKIN